METSLVNSNKEIFKEVLRLSENLRIAEDSPEFVDIMPKETVAFEEAPIDQIIRVLENERYAYLESLNFNDVKMLKLINNIGRNQDYYKDLSPDMIYKTELERLVRNGWASKYIEVAELTKNRASLFIQSFNFGLDSLNISI